MRISRKANLLRAVSVAWFPLTTVASLAHADGFANPSAWTTFDLQANGIGLNPNYFHAFGFDGRFLYLAGDNNFAGEVLRYDTTGDFSSPVAWEAFDPGDGGPTGQAAFDGRYIYFTVGWDGHQHLGVVRRYDTRSAFNATASWAAFDYGAHCQDDLNCHNPKGYFGAVWDGRYVYFSPYFNELDGGHGEVMRYDTHANFETPSSWSTYDYGSDPNGCSMQIGCVDPDGYVGLVFDGRYVYFVPNFNEWNPLQAHGGVLRYDTLGIFNDPTSWRTYDPGANGVGANAKGFQDATFDGRFIYFVPHRDVDEFFGEVLRFDTNAEFSDAASWAAFDPNANGVGEYPIGYAHAVFDGRYVYFGPSENATGWHSEILRYDTDGAFAAASSWTTFDPSGIDGVGQEYNGIVFDGRFVYFVPFGNTFTGNTVVLRYDTELAAQCELRMHGDIAPCRGNGIVNLDDILGVLSAFSGANACPDECVAPQ